MFLNLIYQSLKADSSIGRVKVLDHSRDGIIFGCSSIQVCLFIAKGIGVICCSVFVFYFLLVEVNRIAGIRTFDLKICLP